MAVAPALYACRPGSRVLPVRVLVADRQPLFREAVARAIRQRVALRLVDEVADGRAALAVIAREQPDVAVVDLHLPELDGPRLVNAVVRDDLHTRVLLLAPADEAGRAYEALEAGATGWLSKVADAVELCGAIETAAHGQVAMTPDVQTAVVAEMRRRSSAARRLVEERERRVLLLAAQGKTDREIGVELQVSTGTASATLLELYRRLGVSNRVAAVAEALRRGLID
jgi:two-component system, NarL family, nitrate/nitrite response regulator NarL